MNMSQGLLPFQLIQDASKVLLTSFDGLPLVMEIFWAFRLPQSDSAAYGHELLN